MSAGEKDVSRTLAGGALFSLVRLVAVIAAGLAGTVFLARFLGPADWGIYAAGWSTSLLIVSVIVHGVRDYLIARHDGAPREAQPSPQQPAAAPAAPAPAAVAPEVERLIAARLNARRAKNFAESDRLRDELAAMGIALKDGKDPATGEPTTTWEVKR